MTHGVSNSHYEMTFVYFPAKEADTVMHLCRRCCFLCDQDNTAMCLFCWLGKYCNKRVVVAVVVVVAAAAAVVLIDRSRSVMYRTQFM